MERQYWHLAITASISFGGLIVVLLFTEYDPNQRYANILTAIFFSGSVGAVVNNYFRLSRIASNTDINSNIITNDLQKNSVIMQLYVSLLLSGILGFVAYGLFLSGLLQGALFPMFTHLDLKYGTLNTLLRSVAPVNNLDAAKALIWAFIAGFSERFIPNILDAIVAKAETSSK